MKSKHLSKLLGAFLVALAAVVVMAPMAQAKVPAPPFEKYAGCPSPAENSEVAACVYSKVSGGHFDMGNKSVPITEPLVLTGGVDIELENFAYNSEGGLSEAKQKVPGGVVGLTGLTWLLELLGSKALTLYAVTELAGQPELGLVDITLPVKVHLVNPVLGNNCYVDPTRIRSISN